MSHTEWTERPGSGEKEITVSKDIDEKRGENNSGRWE